MDTSRDALQHIADLFSNVFTLSLCKAAAWGLLQRRTGGVTERFVRTALCKMCLGGPAEHWSVFLMSLWLENHRRGASGLPSHLTALGTGDIDFARLIKATPAPAPGSASGLHCRVTPFPLEVRKCRVGGTWRLCKYPIPSSCLRLTIHYAMKRASLVALR